MSEETDWEKEEICVKCGDAYFINSDKCLAKFHRERAAILSRLVDLNLFIKSYQITLSNLTWEIDRLAKDIEMNRLDS